jgi:hypothetical protein
MLNKNNKEMTGSGTNCDFFMNKNVTFFFIVKKNTFHFLWWNEMNMHDTCARLQVIGVACDI